MTRRGFASMTALGLLALVAAAMVALADRFAEDVRQTLDHATDAQLRQLLIAGAVAVEQGDGDIALASELTRDFAVRIDETIENDRRIVTITASDIHQTERQVLIYLRDTNGWRLEQAQLNPLDQTSTASQ